MRNTTITVDLEPTPATELHGNPIWWAIPDLIPMHRLTLIAAPTGEGLTQLACHLTSALAPDNSKSGTTVSPLSDTSTPADPADPLSLRNAEYTADPNPSDGPDLLLRNTQYGIDSPPAAQPTPEHEQSAADPLPTVLFITSRDEPDLLTDRLLALNVDLSSVLIVSSVTETHQTDMDRYQTSRPFRPSDANQLSEILHENRAIRMVIIDNAEMMFCYKNHPSRLDIHRQLSHLAAVARSREVGIVLLATIPSHRDNPFDSTLLSTFNQAARRTYILAPSLSEPARHLLFCTKDTLDQSTPTLLLNLHSPLPIRASRPQSEITAYPHYLSLLRHPKTRGPAPQQHNYACEVLLEILRAGPLRVGRHPDPARNTIAAHAQNANVCFKTLTRAKETLQITAFKKGNHWYWQLPGTIPQSGSTLSPLSDAPEATVASAIQTPSEIDSNQPSDTPSETCPSSPSNPNATQQPPLNPTPTPPSKDPDLLAPDNRP